MHPTNSADTLRFMNVKLTFHDYKVFWFYYFLTDATLNSIVKNTFEEQTRIRNTLIAETQKSTSLILDILHINKETLAQQLYKLEYLAKQQFEALTTDMFKNLELSKEKLKQQIYE